MGYVEQLMKTEYYIAEDYNEYIMAVVNIFYAFILGTTAFMVIYLIIPVVSALCIICICSFVVEAHNMIKNTAMIIKNMYNGLVSDVKMIIDSIIVIFTIYYLCSILLNVGSCY
jgi:hypothetical protein